MNQQELEQQAMRDLEALARVNERVSLEIRPLDAFFMLSYLQLALGATGLHDPSAYRAEYLARRLQDLVARTAALQTLCERGWSGEAHLSLGALDPSLWQQPLKDALDTITNRLVVAGADVIVLRDTSHIALGLEWPEGGDYLRDLEVQSPHPLVVLAVFPTSDGGPSGIETR